MWHATVIVVPVLIVPGACRLTQTGGLALDRQEPTKSEATPGFPAWIGPCCRQVCHLATPLTPAGNCHVHAGYMRIHACFSSLPLLGILVCSCQQAIT